MADIIVVGIGNPYRGDDAAGWAVIDALEDKVNGARYPCSKQRGDIAELMDIFRIIPSLFGRCLPAQMHLKDPGSASMRCSKPLPVENGQTSTHGLGVGQAVAFAKNLDQLPAKLIIYAIAGDQFADERGLSPAVAQAVSLVAEAILMKRISNYA